MHHFTPKILVDHIACGDFSPESKYRLNEITAHNKFTKKSPETHLSNGSERNVCIRSNRH